MFCSKQLDFLSLCFGGSGTGGCDCDRGGQGRREQEAEGGRGGRGGEDGARMTWKRAPRSVYKHGPSTQLRLIVYIHLYMPFLPGCSCRVTAQQTLSQLSIFSFLSLHFFSFLVLATKKFFLFKILKIQLSSFLLHQSCTAPATPGLNTAWSPGSPCTGPRDRAAATTWRLFSSFPPWSSLWSLSVWCFSSSTDSQRSLQRNGGWRSVIFSFNS